MNAPPQRHLVSWPVALLLGAAIHLDWHVARHGDDHRSMGWRWHWTLAVPMFAAAGWYITRRFEGRIVPAGFLTLGAAVALGQVVEPLGELLLYRLPLSESFGAARLGALAAFLAAGLVSYIAACRVARG